MCILNVCTLIVHTLDSRRKVLLLRKLDCKLNHCSTWYLHRDMNRIIELRQSQQLHLGLVLYANSNITLLLPSKLDICSTAYEALPSNAYPRRDADDKLLQNDGVLIHVTFIYCDLHSQSSTFPSTRV
jgi:hypothetical protein